MQKTVLIGITGCIAAYKSAEIVRALQKRDLRVKVVMTEHATHFIDPLTFRSLTHEPVAVGLFDNPSDPIHHISLAEEADCFAIAPCTANVAAKIAHGIADDLLTTTALACTAPLVIAPAMNVHMYEATATQENLATLARRGAYIVEGIVKALDESVTCDLEGMNVLVTAGPTEEQIDPVRFISNRSSGKMGYAIAEAAAARGANVTLVSGPVSLETPTGVERVSVRTACEMLEAAKSPFEGSDIAVFTAAVSDMRPAAPAEHKLKKSSADDAGLLSRIELVENPDILATLAAAKREGQVVVGFAAETDDVVANAQHKLISKHVDLIVANRVGEGVAFGTDDNQATLVSANGSEALPLMSKRVLADKILDKALTLHSA